MVVPRLEPRHVTAAMTQHITHAIAHSMTRAMVPNMVPQPPCHGAMARSKTHDACHDSHAMMPQPEPRYVTWCHGPCQDM